MLTRRQDAGTHVCLLTQELWLGPPEARPRPDFCWRQGFCHVLGLPLGFCCTQSRSRTSLRDKSPTNSTLAQTLEHTPANTASYHLLKLFLTLLAPDSPGSALYTSALWSSPTPRVLCSRHCSSWSEGQGSLGYRICTQPHLIKGN